MTICIVDTSILCELLNIPTKSSRHELAVSEFAERRGREQFLLPIAVFVETGNHIAQIDDGSARRDRAERFVKLAAAAIEGNSPFVATPFPSVADVSAWLAEFPDRAMEGVGLADKSLIALWEAQRSLNPMRRVYIWSNDKHLQAYDAG